MKNQMTTLLLASLLSSGVLLAGKDVEPAVVPVAPVADINPLYIGLGLLWSGTSKDSCPCTAATRDKDSTYGVIARIGYDFSPYIGIEGRVLRSIIAEDFAKTTHYGIYLKPQYHVTDSINIYGLLGYGKTKIDFSCSQIKDYDDAGVSVGIGVEMDLSRDEPVVASRAFDGQGDQEKGLGVWVDYQHLLNDEGSNNIKSNVVSAGVTYDF